MNYNNYVLDANIFIEAANRYYAFDIAPCFWNAIIEQTGNGRIFSIDRVKDELERQDDDLAKWIKKFFYQWCDTTNQGDVIRDYANIMQWVMSNPQFFPEAKSSFAAGADGWLVAYAMARSCVVVTLEQYDRYIKRKIPIPNVCTYFRVPYIDTFAMLRKLGVKFN